MISLTQRWFRKERGEKGETMRQSAKVDPNHSKTRFICVGVASVQTVKEKNLARSAQLVLGRVRRKSAWPRDA